MTEEQIALARRAVVCKGWKWMPGMLAGGFRICRVDPHGYRFGWSDGSYAYRVTDGVLPDLTDPATLGCLLALVREAHGAPFLQVSVSRKHGYRFECNPRHRGAWVESEEEALVAALEAAP